MAERPIINQSFTKYNYSSGKNSRLYIVMHYTAGNGDSAKGNINYFNSKYIGASAHFFVDEKEIWQNVPIDKIAWHCGTTGKYYSSCRNSNSIGIEMCSRKNSYGQYYIKDETVSNAVKLVKYLMDVYNIPIERVIRHYDVTHKCCPAPWVNNPALFDSFKTRLLSSTSISNKPGIYEVSCSSPLNVRSGPSVNYSKINSITKGTEVVVNKIEYNWAHIISPIEGYVSCDYLKFKSESGGIIVKHWAEDFLVECKEKKWIKSPEVWSNFDGYTTKACAAALLDNITGGTWFSEEAKPEEHWSQPSIYSLAGKKIITDVNQWLQYPDSLISKALWLALICNEKGGISDKYKNRIIDHWGRNCLDTLCDLGIITTPSAWCDDFDAPVTNGSILASVVKSF